MTDTMSFEEVARRVADGETDEEQADESVEADGAGAPEMEDEPDAEPESDEAEEPKQKRRGRPRKPPAPRSRSKRGAPPPDPKQSEEPKRAPTPVAEAGIAEHPDPTAPFPAQREAVADSEPPPAPTPKPSSGNGAARPPERPSLRVYTALDDVPPDESDPLKRDGVTYESVEPEEGMQFPDQSGGRRPPGNLTDVCREYRIGESDSDCYIRVERKKPPSWQGIACAGYLGNIRAPMTEGEFKDLVGGGTYELVVYGPDPRGRSNPYTGTTEIKALTKPIIAHHPGRPKFVDLDSLFESGGGDEDDDEDPRRKKMAGGFGWNAMEGRRMIPGRGEVTTADAKIHQDSLTFAQRELQEQRRELKEAREEARMRSKDDEGATPAVVRAIESAARSGVDAVKETAETTKAMLERQLAEKDRALDEMRKEMREMRSEAQSRPAADNAAWGAFAEMSKAALAGRGGSGDDLARVHDSHQREMDRLHDAHKREIESMRTRYDEVVKAKDSEMERTRSLYAERERDLRNEFERREKSQREEADRREKALDERYRDRIAGMEKDHQRELEAVKRQEELIRETHKSSWETKLSAAEDRARTAKEEAERAREEAANKEDFFAQMEKIQAQAELMGYTKGAEENPPKTWQERIAAAVGNALESAPNIFDAATKTFQARQEAVQASVQAMRIAQAPPPQRQLPPQRQMPPQTRPGQQPAQRRFWASEEGVPIDTSERPTESEVRPEQKPPPVGASGPVSQPQAAQPPPPGPPPPAGPPEPQQGGGELPIPPQMLNQLRLMLEGSYGMGVPSADFAAAFAEEVGVDQLKLVITGMTADTVLDALSEDPQGANSPLLSREGRTWFRGVWAHGAKIVGV